MARLIFCIFAKSTNLYQTMKRTTTREEAMKKFLASRNKKREYLVKLEEDMRKEYKARMGVEEKHFFAL